MKKREIRNFNNDWLFENSISVSLPHTWNDTDSLTGDNSYFRGTCTYTKKFDLDNINTTENEVWLEFAGVAMSAKVILNGQILDKHEGGYSTFRVNLTKVLQTSENILEVSVDNSKNDRIYPQKADFTFYGGIYRNVKLIIVPKEHFALGNHGDTGLKVTTLLSSRLRSSSKAAKWGASFSDQLDENTAVVAVEANIENVSNESTRVRFILGEEEKEAQVKDGKAIAEFEVANPHLWNGKEDPYLYDIKATLTSGDSINQSFGIRYFQVDPENGFYLNGHSLRLCGAARHQDRMGVGNVLTTEDQDQDMEIMLEMGANTIRLAHYQHDQYFYDLCDKKGMIVWAEIPYITEHLANGEENAISQMRELVLQNINHPSIVCWGLSNEITASGGATEEIRATHEKLNNLCHGLDQSRPTTMANVFMLDPDDSLVTLPDIRSYNLYFGWYLGDMDQNDSWFDDYHKNHPDTVMGLSEYGADANPIYHNENPEKSDWTEDYQLLYHAHMLKMWQDRPFIWAMHCWNAFDFGAAGRNEGGKPGQNQKGLVTFDRETKKDAFYIYKAYLSKESFVHLCGKRFEDRTGDETCLRAVTNLDNISWYVDGSLIKEDTVDKITEITISLAGVHEIKIVAVDEVGNEVTDSMVIKKVDKPNPDYVKQGGDVVNWFDREDEIVKEGFFSIKDSIADVKANADAQAVFNEILGPALKAAEEAYGDVAKNITFTPEMLKKMDEMSVEAKLKQVSKFVTPELVHKLNFALNQIEKLS